MKTQVTEQKMRVPCETHTCRNRAAYKIGNPKFPHSCHNVCEDCMKDIVSTLPQELIDVLMPPPSEVTIKEPPVYDFEPESKVDVSHKAEEDTEETNTEGTTEDNQEDNQEENAEGTTEEQENKTIGESMTMKQLRALAEQRGIEVGSRVTKPELLKVLGV